MDSMDIDKKTAQKPDDQSKPSLNVLRRAYSGNDLSNREQSEKAWYSNLLSQAREQREEREKWSISLEERKEALARQEKKLEEQLTFEKKDYSKQAAFRLFEQELKNLMDKTQKQLEEQSQKVVKQNNRYDLAKKAVKNLLQHVKNGLVIKQEELYYEKRLLSDAIGQLVKNMDGPLTRVDQRIEEESQRHLSLKELVESHLSWVSKELQGSLQITPHLFAYERLKTHFDQESKELEESLKSLPQKIQSEVAEIISKLQEIKEILRKLKQEERESFGDNGSFQEHIQINPIEEGYFASGHRETLIAEQQQIFEETADKISAKYDIKTLRLLDEIKQTMNEEEKMKMINNNGIKERINTTIKPLKEKIDILEEVIQKEFLKANYNEIKDDIYKAYIEYKKAKHSARQLDKAIEQARQFEQAKQFRTFPAFKEYEMEKDELNNAQTRWDDAKRKARLARKDRDDLKSNVLEENPLLKKQCQEADVQHINALNDFIKTHGSEQEVRQPAEMSYWNAREKKEKLEKRLIETSKDLQAVETLLRDSSNDRERLHQFFTETHANTYAKWSAARKKELLAAKNLLAAERKLKALDAFVAQKLGDDAFLSQYDALPLKKDLTEYKKALDKLEESYTRYDTLSKKVEVTEKLSRQMKKVSHRYASLCDRLDSLKRSEKQEKCNATNEKLKKIRKDKKSIDTAISQASQALDEAKKQEEKVQSAIDAFEKKLPAEDALRLYQDLDRKNHEISKEETQLEFIANKRLEIVNKIVSLKQEIDQSKKYLRIKAEQIKKYSRQMLNKENFCESLRERKAKVQENKLDELIEDNYIKNLKFYQDKLHQMQYHIPNIYNYNHVSSLLWHRNSLADALEQDQKSIQDYQKEIQTENNTAESDIIFLQLEKNMKQIKKDLKYCSSSKNIIDERAKLVDALKKAQESIQDYQKEIQSENNTAESDIILLNPQNYIIKANYYNKYLITMSKPMETLHKIREKIHHYPKNFNASKEVNDLSAVLDETYKLMKKHYDEHNSKYIKLQTNFEVYFSEIQQQKENLNSEIKHRSQEIINAKRAVYEEYRKDRYLIGKLENIEKDKKALEEQLEKTESNSGSYENIKYLIEMNKLNHSLIIYQLSTDIRNSANAEEAKINLDRLYIVDAEIIYLKNSAQLYDKCIIAELKFEKAVGDKKEVYEKEYDILKRKYLKYINDEINEYKNKMSEFDKMKREMEDRESELSSKQEQLQAISPKKCSKNLSIEEKILKGKIQSYKKEKQELSDSIRERVVQESEANNLKKSIADLAIARITQIYGLTPASPKDARVSPDELSRELDQLHLGSPTPKDDSMSESSFDDDFLTLIDELQRSSPTREDDWASESSSDDDLFIQVD